jgi:glycogen debranching enzyme
MNRQTLLARTAEQAKEVFNKNRYEVRLNNIRYKRTVPSKKFYVHQWKWDSATHAMGLIHVDPERAYDELRALFAGQWENGMIPHMIFNPEESKYFPNASVWQTRNFANREIVTSGITQPPLIARSVLYLYETDQNRKRAEAFLVEAMGPLMREHEYLKTYRDPSNTGLLTIIHPWEGGTDNSPRYDDAMERIPLSDIPERVKKLSLRRTDIKLGKKAHRPTQEDYYRYLYLVDLFGKWNWDYKKIIAESPFATQDILFNGLWYEANRSLAILCQKAGKRSTAKKYEKYAAQTREAMISLWDPGSNQFVNMDVAMGRSLVIRENTNGTFLPLYIPDLPKPILNGLLGKLEDPKEYASAFPVASTALNSPKFDLMRYWRGPTWPITNLFIIEGLGRQKGKRSKKLRDKIINSTLNVISEQGFYEYYDPTLTQYQLSNKVKDEKALGFGSFSWTAAVFLYLYNEFVLK